MRNLGTILLLIGIGMFFIFGGFGFLEFLLSPEIPLLVKIAVLSVIVGLVLIVISIIKESAGKKDKYEEVEK